MEPEHNYRAALLKLETLCKDLREGKATAQQYQDQRKIMTAQVKIIDRRARNLGRDWE